MKTKTNFRVDPDFPVIDGVGHSDKIDFFNVKGGGSTNTTFLDPCNDDLHCYYTARSVCSPVPTDLSCARVDPDVQCNDTQPFIWFGASPGCLNSMYVGDNFQARGSDRICMNRLEVSGTLHRPAGTDEDDYSSIAPAPKCFVAVVLDTRSDGAVPPSNWFMQFGGLCGPFDTAGAPNPAATNEYSTVPWIGYGSSGRFRVLASDVIDFGLNPGTHYTWVDYADTTTTEGGPLPAPETTTVVTRTRYSFWRDVVLGFRFDIDLNDVICSFKSDSHSIADVVDNSLHVYALCFDGVNQNAYVPHNFGVLSLKYISRLWFSDFLTPKIPHAPAGVDGDVVPDEEVPLAILADQSGLMAGDGSFLDRPVKRTKAAHGFYNFAPRAGDAMLFEDDPEFARLQRRKGDSRSRAPEIVQRRFKSHKYDDNEDFNAREGDRGGKRGKY